MRADEKKKLTLAGVLFTLAILFFFLFSSSEREALEYYYDESEQKLFTAPAGAGSIPPIKGINDNQLDGVRAIVIAPKGKRGDKSAHRIAYLEKWSPQLKQQMEAAIRAKAAGHSVPNLVDRSQRKFHQFVRREDSPQWYSLNTDEAAKIMAVLRTKDANGNTPDICMPGH